MAPARATAGVYDVLVTIGCGGALSDGALVRPVGCTGDANPDGVVDFLDLNVVLGQYGQTGAGLPGDLDHNGVLDFVDLNLLLGVYGAIC